MIRSFVSSEKGKRGILGDVDFENGYRRRDCRRLQGAETLPRRAEGKESVGQPSLARGPEGKASAVGGNLSRQ